MLGKYDGKDMLCCAVLMVLLAPEAFSFGGVVECWKGNKCAVAIESAAAAAANSVLCAPRG